MRYFKTPAITKALNPQLIWELAVDDAIYLTFDDGPDPETTPWVLDQLQQYGAKATFFCLGKHLHAYPELAKELIAQNHVVGNHTWNHSNGWQTSAVSYQEDVTLCDDALRRLDVHTTLFRPPYGKVTRKIRKGIGDKRIVMWSHASYDFDPNLDVHRAIGALKKAQAGSIVLFHDCGKAFPKLKRILPEMLSWYSKEGFKLKSIQ